MEEKGEDEVGEEDRWVTGRKDEMSDGLELKRRNLGKMAEQTEKLKKSEKRSRKRSRRSRRDSRLRRPKMEQDA